MIDAAIPIWKPIDWTSFDVVKKIRGQIKPAKVGHAGSLDPFAEGVLMLCAGKYTKKVESFMDKEKEYSAEIQLGIETDTLDPTGKIVETSYVPHLTQDKIKGVLSSLTEVALTFLLLGIVLQVVFGVVPFFPADVIGNLTSLIGSLGDAGVVGLIAIAVIYWLANRGKK